MSVSSSSALSPTCAESMALRLVGGAAGTSVSFDVLGVDALRTKLYWSVSMTTTSFRIQGISNPVSSSTSTISEPWNPVIFPPPVAFRKRTLSPMFMCICVCKFFLRSLRHAGLEEECSCLPQQRGMGNGDCLSPKRRSQLPSAPSLCYLIPKGPGINAPLSLRHTSYSALVCASFSSSSASSCFRRSMRRSTSATRLFPLFDLEDRKVRLVS